MMMENRRRSLELADFLKNRRISLDPADFGISTSRRRRTPGLRREEIAHLAGISLTWYTWIEQGRDIQLSNSALNNLAIALKLSPIERDHLYALAGKQNTASASAEETVSEHLRTMVANMGTNPACILGRRWDILAWNDAACALLGDFNAMPMEERNTILRLFQNNNLRSRVVNRNQVTQQVLARFRMSYDLYAGDPWFEQLVEKLHKNSLEFRQLWSKHSVLGPDDGYREVNHPQVGKMAFYHETFRVFDSPDLKLFLYVPMKKFNTEDKTKEIIQNFRHYRDCPTSLLVE